MRYIDYAGMHASVIAAGAMRIVSFSEDETENYIKELLSLGVDFFDHADIYGRGHCEELFGSYLKKHPGDRGRMYIQSKCGIREGFFDFSFDHIIEAVEGSLGRLNTDYLDCLLLHRPDVLMEPEQVDKAFEKLYSEGKVLNFGVSNMNRYQLSLLQSGIGRRLAVDQLQMSIAHTPLIDAGLNVNMNNNASVMRDAGTLEYLRESDMVLQVWSPLQKGYFEGSFLDSAEYPELNDVLDELSEKYGCGKDAIAYAWLLRLPPTAMSSH